MIEFIAGVIIGASGGVVLAGLLAAAGRADSDAENRALRSALRLARTWAFQSRHQFLVSIIDRALDDEAGA